MPIQSINNLDESKIFTWCKGCDTLQIVDRIKHDNQLRLIGCSNCRDTKLNQLISLF